MLIPVSPSIIIPETSRDYRVRTGNNLKVHRKSANSKQCRYLHAVCMIVSRIDQIGIPDSGLPFVLLFRVIKRIAGLAYSIASFGIGEF
jgi:hypothetical protein